MSKPWVHEDCLELVTNLADMNCRASIDDGIMTLEDGTQIDLFVTAKKEWEATIRRVQNLFRGVEGDKEPS